MRGVMGCECCLRVREKGLGIRREGARGEKERGGRGDVGKAHTTAPRMAVDVRAPPFLPLLCVRRGMAGTREAPLVNVCVHVLGCGSLSLRF